MSAATGTAVAAALTRGIAWRNTDRLGNFWVDLTRACLRILLPIAAVRRHRVGAERGSSPVTGRALVVVLPVLVREVVVESLVKFAVPNEDPGCIQAEFGSVQPLLTPSPQADALE